MKNILTVCLLLTLGFLQAQSSKTKNYKKNPYWIEMIKDPNVNYFDAVKAYDEFWKNKTKPKDENEVIGQTKGTEVEKDKMESQKEQKERRREKELYKKYGLECKKFEHWKVKVKPYIQPDGHILTPDEQLKLWEKK